MPFAGDYGGTEIHTEPRCIHGMAEEFIGTGADELVTHFDCDFAAPLSAEVAARPNAENTA